jgi:LEA14-like dessication related protein
MLTPYRPRRPSSLRVVRLLACVGVLTLMGCSAFLPKLETPRLSVVALELGKSDFFAQHLKVRMRVENPNDRALPVKRLTYQLEVAGQPFAQGAADESFTVPALGETQFDMTVTADMAGAVMRLLGRGLNSQIEYRIVGKVEFEHGFVRSVPFEQKGTFSLNGS